MCIRNNMDLVFINAYTTFFIKIRLFVLKILRKNTFLHQAMAITLLIIDKLSSFTIPDHSSLISMSMQNLKKNRSQTTQVSPETTFLHQSRAITLLFMNEFSPFAIPNHSTPISMSMQGSKKIGQNYSS